MSTGPFAVTGADPELYDRIGKTYRATRRPNQRIAEAIRCCSTRTLVWRRPEAYLDPDVRAGISVFTQLGSSAVTRALDALRADLDNGRWRECHDELLTMDELHLGYYVVAAVANKESGGRK